MTERPILFSGAMVRAILEGRKTMTRRVVKPQPPKDAEMCFPNSYEGLGGPTFWWSKKSTRAVVWPDPNGPLVTCPYGKPGDRLWVKEKWQCREEELPLLPLEPYLWPFWQKRIRYATEGDYDVVNPKPWKPSTHMPRWASRITLEITGVRVERLQEISEDDAIAEGSQVPCAELPRGACQQAAWTERQAFSRIWDSINGKRPGCSWSDNPWVWCVSFRRVQ